MLLSSIFQRFSHCRKLHSHYSFIIYFIDMFILNVYNIYPIPLEGLQIIDWSCSFSKSFQIVHVSAESRVMQRAQHSRWPESILIQACKKDDTESVCERPWAAEINDALHHMLTAELFRRWDDGSHPNKHRYRLLQENTKTGWSYLYTQMQSDGINLKVNLKLRFCLCLNSFGSSWSDWPSQPTGWGTCPIRDYIRGYIIFIYLDLKPDIYNQQTVKQTVEQKIDSRSPDRSRFALILSSSASN